MDLKLVMFRPDGHRKDFPITSPAIVIGRGEECDLRVPLASVSRRHCELTASGGTVKVKDLASSNGTYVNNKRVNETQLKAGDRLVVGPVVFTVQIDGKPEEIRPVKVRPESRESVKSKTGSQYALADSGAVVTAAAKGQVEEEDDDVIAALEALASDEEEENKRKKR